jgi:hypothetical protein
MRQFLEREIDGQDLFRFRSLRHQGIGEFDRDGILAALAASVVYRKYLYNGKRMVQT